MCVYICVYIHINMYVCVCRYSFNKDCSLYEGPIWDLVLEEIMNSGCLRGWGRYLWTSECMFPSISPKGNYSSKCFREVCLVFDKSVLCISSNLEIGTLSGLLLLHAPHRWVYANHLDILYSFSVRGTLYSALMGTLVSNEKSDEIRCFEYRTCANFRSFIIPLKFISSR